MKAGCCAVTARRVRRAAGLAGLLFAAGLALAGGAASPTDESAYAPADLARIFGGEARSRNDEAELAAPGEWYSTTATFTGRKRPPSGRNRPIINAWLSSQGQDASAAEPYFSGDLPELEFAQSGRRYWVMAGLPGGLGFDVYPPGQELTIYLQRIGFSSGSPVVMLTMARLPAGVTATSAARGRVMRNARMGEGARRQEAVFRTGTATFTYAGREYSLPLDAAGRHSVAPGLYSYENGVRTALLEYGSDDTQYLLLRVPVPDAAGSDVVPYLVLNGRIVPPIDVSSCEVRVEQVARAGTRGGVDCAAVARAVLSKLRFTAE